MLTLKISLLVFILSTTISAQWYQQNSGTTNTLFQLQFVSEQVGWTNNGPELYKTTDGGAIWQPIYFNSYGVFQFSFFNENIGWALIANNPFPELLRSTDGGVTWIGSYAAAFDYIRDFELINPDTGWIVGEQTVSYESDSFSKSAEFPVLFKETTDAGMTWVDKNFTSIPLGGLNDIDSIDYLNLIVAGWDTLYKTTNGGINWQKYPLPQGGNYTIQFFNVNNGWSSTGGKLFKTTDGGISWYQQAVPITSFYFASTQIGWYTYDNQIYISTNGGNTWAPQNSNTNNTLTDIFFINSNLGWAVGANGTILQTNNGGTPVELISFIADYIKSESAIEITWATATETNNQGFEILRFTQNDNDEWNKIGFVPGHGTTTETQHYTFTDNDVKPGKYQYKLRQIDYDGSFEYSQIVEIEIPFVSEFSLFQNYPNPFNPTTKIKYSIPTVALRPALPAGRQAQSDITVTLKVYDLLGSEVATLVNEEKPDGEYEVEFDATGLSSGIYFYQLKAGQFSETKKMVLLR